MKVTYIHHSGFMAELEHAALLFDYFEGEIPAVEEMCIRDSLRPVRVCQEHQDRRRNPDVPEALPHCRPWIYPGQQDGGNRGIGKGDVRLLPGGCH